MSSRKSVNIKRDKRRENKVGRVSPHHKEEPEQPDQGSGTVPDLPLSSPRLILASNSRVEEEMMRPRHGDKHSVIDDDDEDENEHIPLDPDHPLIKRYQVALKKQLCAQLEKLDKDIQEKLMDEQQLKTKFDEVKAAAAHEEQVLTKEQAYLKDFCQNRDKASTDREQGQKVLEEIRKEHSRLAQLMKEEHKKESELDTEVERVTCSLMYMERWATEIRSDVAIVKTAKAKAQAQKRQAVERKLQQDLYVERLMKQMEKLREQIALYDGQTLIVTKEKQSLQEILAEAQLELDSMMVERKQLLQQWHSCTIEMSRRDEAFTMVEEMLRSANQELRALKTELEGYNRAITQEQEKNEELTMQRKRVELNCNTYRKLLTQSLTQQEVLKDNCTTYTRTLEETENSLNRVTKEYSRLQSDLSILDKQLEKTTSVKVKLEEKIMRRMQDQLAHNSTAKRKHHLITKTMALQREKEAQLKNVQSEVAAVELEISELEQRVQVLSNLKLELEQEVMQRNQLLSTREAAFAELITTIERKQAIISKYTEKVQQMTVSTGNEVLGPLEIKVKTLNKQLEQLEAQIKEQQQSWLRQQGELLRLTEEKQSQSSAVLLLKHRLSVMEQKTLRTKREIAQEEHDLVDLGKQFKAMRSDMEKLTLLLNQNKKLKQELKQSNILMKKGFKHKLKDAERERVKKQLHLEDLQEEKEQLLNTLVEAERQIMLWERKIQLARETCLAVEDEKEDIKTLKAEIHRMEVHYSQLMKQQEKMLKELEMSVVRREGTVALSESQLRRKHKNNGLQNTLKMLRSSIRQSHKQMEEYDSVIELLQLEQSSLSESLRETQKQITDLKNTGSALRDELKNMQETKERNLIQLVALQSRVKQLQAVKEGRYRVTARGEDELKLTINKLQEHLRSIRDVLQQVVQDSPQHEPLFHRVLLLLSVHLDRT